MRRIKSLPAVLVGASALGATGAHAAVPAEATAAVSEMVTDATTYIAGFWPLLIAVVGVFTFMKLTKKGFSRAT